jgi:hypothetical protein
LRSRKTKGCKTLYGFSKGKRGGGIPRRMHTSHASVKWGTSLQKTRGDKPIHPRREAINSRQISARRDIALMFFTKVIGKALLHS